jgi:hypothetical protein
MTDLEKEPAPKDNDQKKSVGWWIWLILTTMFGGMVESLSNGHPIEFFIKLFDLIFH